MKEEAEFGADPVIVAIGENVPQLDSDKARAQFKNAVLKLVNAVEASRRSTIVVRSCFWPNKDKDPILEQACQEVGGVYVDIGGLSNDESNYARSERMIPHRGVGSHPGDKGMKVIADAILDAIYNQGA